MSPSSDPSNVIHLPSGGVAIAAAVDLLLAGNLVAFPTETVYGLGADAENPEAVEKIYLAKGRPSNHPVIVHVAPDVDLSYWVAAIPWQAQRLIDAFWPGPLTLILKRAAHIPSTVSGGQDSIGLRCPSHPIALELLRRFAQAKPSGQGGIAAPSANQFGHVSPTQASHVREEFPEQLLNGMMVLEGGASQVGIESTIIDLSRVDAGVGPVLLRPGFISASQIEEVLGQTVLAPDAQAPRVSGALKSHYAPNTPLLLAVIEDLRVLAQRPVALRANQRLALVSHSTPPTEVTTHPQVDWITASSDPIIYAHDLYMLLRELDKQGYARIVFEAVPDTTAWLAVRDRLSRAAAQKDSGENPEDSQA